MTVTVVGVPFDEASSYRRGAAGGPAKIREALDCESSNRWTESGRDLGAEPRFEVAGDLALPAGDLPGAMAAIEAGCAELLDRGHRVLALGGDHSITIGTLRAYGPRFPGLSILHFDAHPDLYDEFEGEPLSHACPFARIMETGLAKRLVQVGIRTMTDHQRQQAERFGVEVIEMNAFDPGLTLSFDAPVYVSIDLDGLDPAFAPGVSHHEPGGLSTRELLGVLARFDGEVVGADVVELNPSRDVEGVTAMVAAKLTKELAGRMLP